MDKDMEEQWISFLKFCAWYGTDPMVAVFIAINRMTGDYIIMENNDGHYIPTEAKIILDGVKRKLYEDVDRINRERQKKRKELSQL